MIQLKSVQRPKRWPEVLGAAAAALLLAAEVVNALTAVFPAIPRGWLLASALAVIGFSGGIAVGRRRWSRGAPARAPATHFVHCLHDRWFPGTLEGAHDSRYRVSYFEPRPGPGKEAKCWKCLARTVMEPDTAREWPVPSTPEEWTRGGLVVHSAKQGAGTLVAGLPKQGESSAEDLATYRMMSKVDEATHGKRSWRYATLRTHVVLDQAGLVTGVVVVERQDGQTIDDSTRSNDEAELAATVWAAAWEEEKQ